MRFRSGVGSRRSQKSKETGFLFDRKIFSKPWKICQTKIIIKREKLGRPKSPTLPMSFPCIVLAEPGIIVLTLRFFPVLTSSFLFTLLKKTPGYSRAHIFLSL